MPAAVVAVPFPTLPSIITRSGETIGEIVDLCNLGSVRNGLGQQLLVRQTLPCLTLREGLSLNDAIHWRCPAHTSPGEFSSRDDQPDTPFVRIMLKEVQEPVFEVLTGRLQLSKHSTMKCC